MSAAELAAAAVVFVIVIAFAVYGQALARAADADKRAVIERVRGRHVVVLVDRGKSVRVQRAGHLEMSEDQRSAVLTADDGRHYQLPLGQIRKIEDSNGVQGEW